MSQGEFVGNVAVLAVAATQVPGSNVGHVKTKP